MAKWQGELISAWGKQGNIRVPQIALDYAGLRTSDTVSQESRRIPPDPNVVMVWFECEGAVLDEIEKNNAYTVLWSEEVADADRQG